MPMTDNPGLGHNALLVDASASGSYQSWPGGRGTFTVGGTFGGATVKLQMEGPNGGDIDVGEHVTFTAPNGGNFELAPCRIKAAVSGGTPSGLYATAHLIPQTA